MPKPKYDFKKIFIHYPDVIKRMEKDFTSHQFIQKLTQKHQQEYIDALVAYQGSEPFRIVHRELASGLRRFKNLVTYVGIKKDSHDIFGFSQTCTKWRKSDPV